MQEFNYKGAADGMLNGEPETTFQYIGVLKNKTKTFCLTNSELNFIIYY